MRNRAEIEMSKSSIHNKVAIVTGGAGGIGAAIAMSLGRAGAKIALLDLSGEALSQQCERLKTAGIDCLGVECDITDAGACETAVTRVRKELGHIDILCNNAGITRISRFSDTPGDVLRRVMDVNFYGAVNMTRACLDDLIKTKGLVEVTSSIAGFASLFGRTAYCASKHALHGFFDSLRSELRDKGVTVLLACPGYTRTSIAQTAYGPGFESQAARGKETDPGKVGNQIAAAILDGRERALLDLSGKLAWFIARFAPRMYERLMMRQAMQGFTEPPT